MNKLKDMNELIDELQEVGDCSYKIMEMYGRCNITLTKWKNEILRLNENRRHRDYLEHRDQPNLGCLQR